MPNDNYTLCSPGPATHCPIIKEFVDQICPDCFGPILSIPLADFRTGFSSDNRGRESLVFIMRDVTRFTPLLARLVQ